MKKNVIIVGVLSLLVIGTGIVVYQTVAPAKDSQKTSQIAPTPVVVPTVDATVLVTLQKAAKANTVTLSVSGLSGAYKSVGYELSYESKGLIKGVNSGGSPLDIAGKSELSRDVYLGTCSRNVCTADPGVTSVSVVLEFTKTTGEKSQFSKDFTL